MPKPATTATTKSFKKRQLSFPPKATNIPLVPNVPKPWHHYWYQWVCSCPLQSCITHQRNHLSGLPRLGNTKAHKVSWHTRHHKHFLCLEVVWDAWLSPHDRWLHRSLGNWQSSSHAWKKRCQELLMHHQVVPHQGLPAAPNLCSTWSCCSFASCSSALLVSFVMVWWQLYRPTAGRRSGMLHGWCALCSLDFCWRGSGTQENPSHWAILRDDSVKKAKDKAVTPNWLFWPEMGQTLTQAVAEQIHFVLASLNNLLFLWGKKLARC